MRNEIVEILSSQLDDFRRRLPEDLFRKTLLESLEKTDELTPLQRASKRKLTYNDDETVCHCASFLPVHMSTPIKKKRAMSREDEFECKLYKEFARECESVFISEHLMKPGTDKIRLKPGMKIIISYHNLSLTITFVIYDRQ